MGQLVAMFDFDEIEEKLQAAEKASERTVQPSSAACSFDGEWEDDDGTVVTIKKGEMRGADGIQIEVSFPEADSIAFCPGAGHYFKGKLQDSRICWSDGATWVRRAVGTAASAAPQAPRSTGTDATAKAFAKPSASATKRVDPPQSTSKSQGKMPQESSRTGNAKKVAPQAPASSASAKTSKEKLSAVDACESPWQHERYEVMKPVVFVRETPGLDAAKVAQVRRGCMVSGRVSNGWLCLDHETRSTANVPETAAGAFMLIDGRSRGLGLLLESRGCHGSSKDSLAMPLEFLALRDLRLRDKPDSEATGRLIAEGSIVKGYPGAESWLEVAGGGFLPITSAAEAKTTTDVSEAKDFLELRSALQPLLPQIFAEAIQVKWEPLPLQSAAHVEYSLQWQDLGETARGGRVSAARRCTAHLRSLPPAVPLRIRIVARIFAPLPGGNPCYRGKEDPTSRSWQDQRLVGRWLYGAKPSEYRIGRRTDGSLIWIGPHATGGTVMGTLEPEEHWLQAELASARGDIVGHIRLFYDEQEDAVISNFKNIQNPDWGRDIIAKKGGDEEVLTTLLGRWIPVSTAAPVTDREEEESCYDPLCNKRGKCQRCSCQIFVISEHLLGQELEDICCRRCGCSVAYHAKVGKFRLNGKVPEAVGTEKGASRPGPGPPPKSPMDEIPSRQWLLDDAADEDPVEFIIRQLENAKNLYEVLGVPPSASPLAIRQAYRAISLRVHPDKIIDSEEQGLAALAEDAFKLASSAYEVLSDEVERKAYDRELRAEYLRMVKLQPKPKPKPPVKPKPEVKKPVSQPDPAEKQDPGRGVDEFFKNPTIGTFMNSPYYGTDGVFGTSGTIKENAAGGFSFELPGGGGIHIDSGSGYQRLKQMEEEMAQTGHIPPHLWPQGLFPQGNTFAVNSGPAWVGWQQHQAAEKKRQEKAQQEAAAKEPEGSGPWTPSPGYPFRPMGNSTSGVNPQFSRFGHLGGK